MSEENQRPPLRDAHDRVERVAERRVRARAEELKRPLREVVRRRRLRGQRRRTVGAARAVRGGRGGRGRRCALRDRRRDRNREHLTLVVFADLTSLATLLRLLRGLLLLLA